MSIVNFLERDDIIPLLKDNPDDLFNNFNYVNNINILLTKIINKDLDKSNNGSKETLKNISIEETVEDALKKLIQLQGKNPQRDISVKDLFKEAEINIDNKINRQYLPIIKEKKNRN